MDLFSGISEEVKKKVVFCWSRMSEDEKAHFINQVSLTLSICGSDEAGKVFVVRILEKMVSDGSQNLSDFGLYMENVVNNEGVPELSGKMRRATLIIDGYRIKNSLSSEPHKDIGI